MMFSNRNSAFRRSRVIDHPFHQRIPGAEDLAWADWVERSGWAIYYEPTAPVYHSHGESLPRLLRRMIKDQPTIIGLKLHMLNRGQRQDLHAARDALSSTQTGPLGSASGRAT